MGARMAEAKAKPKWLTVKEAAIESKMGYSTLRKKIELGLLKAYKPAKEVLIDPKELEVFIRKARKKIAS